MYLKKLKLIGFKSFARKTDLQFDPGITAVVGPNGSGKSNISDAIRWVLGEQSSKSLRSTKMEEVIFSGSSARKPTNLAEVSIVLDNSDHVLPLDFTEVTLTRKYFRAQESEYRINDVACRLKDIQDLMMDTGLGKGTYSIIGQGQIDQILSNRPMDRRGIFEEAAGINKYKQRKELTLRKLDNVSINLLRLNDIISEIESRVEPLEQQAEKAQQYREIRKEIDVLEKSVLFYDAQGLADQIEIISEQIRQAQESALGVETEISGRELEIERLRHDASDLEAQIQALIQRRSEIKNDLDSTQRSRDYSRDRASDLLARVDDLETEIKIARERIQRNAETRAELESARTRAQNRLAGIESSYEDRGRKVQQMELDLDRVRQQVEDLKARVADAADRLARARNELSSQEVHLTHRRDAREKRARAREAMQQQGREIDAETARLAADLEQARTDSEAVARELGECNAELGSRRAELEGGRQRLAEDKEALARVDSELTLLQRMEAEFEGYGKGVREALQRKEAGDERFAGVIGDAARAIRVRDDRPGVEQAVETLLGESLQCIFVTDAEAAYKAADALRTDNLGRAAFFPVADAPPFPESAADRDRIAAAPGFEMFLFDAVECEERFREPLKWLFSGSALVADRAAAARLMAEPGLGSPVVTVDGEIMLAPGIIRSSPSADAGPGLISRRRRIEELAAARDKLLAAIDERTAGIQRLTSAIDELERKRHEREETAQSLRNSIVQHETRLHSRQETRRGLSRELAAADEEIKTLDGDIEDLTARIEQARDSVRTLEAEKAEYDEKLLEMERALTQSAAQRDTDKEELSQIQIESANLRGELDTVANDLTRLDYDDKEQAAAVENKLNQIEAVKLRQAQYVEESRKADGDAEALGATLDKVDSELNEVRERKSTLDKQLIETDSALRRQRKTFMEGRETVNELKIKLSRFESKREEIAVRLEEMYGLTLDEAPEEVQLQRGAKTQLRDLRSRLEELGTVNLLAIEEHRSVMERLKFLEMHREDLLRSREDLLGVIAEIDKISKESFVEMFNKINEQFGEVFAQLFGGGEAELRLTDPDNPLESGIEIDITLPGKTRQNLLLLSGGEKALSATALLFAILKVKPTPFCILDEIDAPLDESNVQGFCEMLKIFGTETQFLIITHNKGTMEAADTLYGVTMEEEGVSKVVSVKLSEAEQIVDSAAGEETRVDIQEEAGEPDAGTG